MNLLNRAICEERCQVKICLGNIAAATTCWLLLLLPLPLLPLSSLSLTPRPNPEDTKCNMISGVGWHGASRPVVIVVRLDAGSMKEKRMVSQQNLHACSG